MLHGKGKGPMAFNYIASQNIISSFGVALCKKKNHVIHLTVGQGPRVVLLNNLTNSQTSIPMGNL